MTFLHCGGLYDEGKHPKNVGSYFGYIDEAQYVSGIVAGLTTKTNKLGFIAAKPIPQVLRNINAFTLGAQSVNPQGDDYRHLHGRLVLPVKEAEAANSLIDQGIDVADRARRFAQGHRRDRRAPGHFRCGYHASQAALAPKGYLTGAEWNWGKIYTRYIEVDSGPASRSRTCSAVDSRKASSRCRRTVPRSRRREARRPTPPRPSSWTAPWSFSRAARRTTRERRSFQPVPTETQTDIALEKMDYLVAGRRRADAVT